MTASSIEFFPTQVKIIGLPTQATQQIRNVTTRVAPSAATRLANAAAKGVKRNLFGNAAPPGEIDEMLRNENQRNARKLSRYIVEDNATTTTSTSHGINTAVEQHASSAASAPLPIRIQQELDQYNQNSKRSRANQLNAGETTPPSLRSNSNANAKCSPVIVVSTVSVVSAAAVAAAGKTRLSKLHEHKTIPTDHFFVKRKTTLPCNLKKAEEYLPKSKCLDKTAAPSDSVAANCSSIEKTTTSSSSSSSSSLLSTIAQQQQQQET